MDGELINTVTQQVIRMLRQQGVMVTGASASKTAPAFPATAAPQPRKSEPDSPSRGGGRVFITAEELTRRLAASGGGAIDLASNEYLTPSAIDLVDQRRVTVRRSAAPASSQAQAAVKGVEPAGNPGPAASPSSPSSRVSLGIITHRVDDKVRSVLASLGREGVAMVDLTDGECWMADLRRLCQAVVSGQVGAGAAVLPYAADAMALAGKIKGIRPVQGTRPESVAAALRHFGANLLVLEVAFSTYHQLRTMLRVFATGQRGAGEAGAKMLEELERS